MIYGILGDAVLLCHLAFILFAVLGGFLVLRHRGVLLLHVPALCWAVFIEFSGAICPLTPLENRLRQLAGETGYDGTFIGHYLLPLIYPPGLTAEIQVVLGLAVAAINLVVYAVVLYRLTRARHRPTTAAGRRSS